MEFGFFYDLGDYVILEIEAQINITVKDGY
jgi:hypothetical protein